MNVRVVRLIPDCACPSCGRVPNDRIFGHTRDDYASKPASYPVRSHRCTKPGCDTDFVILAGHYARAYPEPGLVTQEQRDDCVYPQGIAFDGLVNPAKPKG